MQGDDMFHVWPAGSLHSQVLASSSLGSELGGSTSHSSQPAGSRGTRTFTVARDMSPDSLSTGYSPAPSPERGQVTGLSALHCTLSSTDRDRDISSEAEPGT
jgi:hypothetical protein